MGGEIKVIAFLTVLSGIATSSGIIGMAVDGDGPKGRWVAAWIGGFIGWVIFGIVWSIQSA